MLGALGPKMFALAGEIGDGVIMVFSAAEQTPHLLADMHKGAHAAGRDATALDVVAKLFVAVDEDSAELKAMLRRLLVGYATVPAYNALLRRQGFVVEAEAMADAWARGDRREALAAVSDDLLHTLYVFGSASECAARLEAYAAAGVRTPLIAPTTAAADLDTRRRNVTGTIELAARTLAPAVA
jgi:alkanesulfonate monooxygenase SsuD/methylene tetrahydromethanopterin reductase-like flavin-dependent oxidoreductase (luciferase family)